MSKPILTQVIERARDLVADRGTWTSHALARRANSEACQPTDPRAVRFCAFGALVRAAYDLTNSGEQAQRLADLAAAELVGTKAPERAYMDLYCINDGGSRSSARKAVLGLFEKALDRA